MRLVSRLSLVAVTLALFTACGGDDDPVTPPTPTLAVSTTSTTATITRGGTTTIPVTITRGGGYTGNATLTVTGLPNDVQGVFAPATLTAGQTTSTLTLTAGANAATGPATISIRAAGPNNTPQSTAATVALTVNAPAASVALTLGQNTATVTQGNTVTVPINLARINFANPIAVAITGLPAGVTATLNPVSPLGGTVNSTTLTLTAAAGATVGGPTNVTITASDPATTPAFTAQTQTLALTVAASTTPGITLTAGPTTITQVAGTTTPSTSTITLARQGGLTGDVALTVTGAPAGLTATLTPTSLSGTTITSTLNVTSTAAVAPGTYNLTITGTAGNVTTTSTVAVTITAPPGIGLTLGTPALSVPAGGNASSTITLARNGGLTGDVTLTAAATTGNLPAGMTVEFTPANGVIAGTATTGTITVRTTAATPAGTYNLTLRGTGANNVVGTVPFTVTVTTPPGITLAAANVTAAAGSTTSTSAITITRAGGFTGDVTLALSGLPQGVTGTFTPVGTTNASTLTLNVPANITPGTYTGTITGSNAGITNATTTFTLTVTGGNTGGGNVAFRFCAQNVTPVFLAFRSGTTGAWTAVTAGANNTYSFTLTQNVGQVAYGVANDNGGVDMSVLYYTAAEFPNIANAQCINNPATKSVTGTVAGLAAGQTATIQLGGGSASVTQNGQFTITDATAAATDLIATRSSFNPTTFAITVDRVIIRRNVNPAPGGSIGAVLDFSAAEAVPPASAQYTVTNLAAGEQVLAFNAFQTANGGSAGFTNLSQNQTSPFTVLGLPSNLTQAGDFNAVTVFASNETATSMRGVFQYNRELANRSITLGPVATAPTLTTIGTTPYARIRASGSWQTEYGDALGITYTQGNARNWTIGASRGYTGAGNTYELDIPDLSGVPGFNNAWGLVAGQPVTWSFTAYAGLQSLGIAQPTEGTVARLAARTGTYTPQ